MAASRCPWAMSERATELLTDFKRYLKEAVEEWLNSVEDSPPSHVYSALIGILIIKAVGWIL